MNLYRLIGDRIGTPEARELSHRLMAWHDAMVKHLRSLDLRRDGCDDGCPHDDARALWSSALEHFGDQADDLRFLSTHGGPRPGMLGHRAIAELRA